MKIFSYTGLLLLLVLSFNDAIAQQQKEGPNIIFIITDDQQTGLLGVEGHSHQKLEIYSIYGGGHSSGIVQS